MLRRAVASVRLQVSKLQSCIGRTWLAGACAVRCMQGAGQGWHAMGRGRGAGGLNWTWCRVADTLRELLCLKPGFAGEKVGTVHAKEHSQQRTAKRLARPDFDLRKPPMAAGCRPTGPRQSDAGSLLIGDRCVQQRSEQQAPIPFLSVHSSTLLQTYQSVARGRHWASSPY